MSLVERRLGWITVDGQRHPLAKAGDWQEAVQRGLCPFCGEGPFAVVAMHVNRRHGLNRREFREVLGVPVSASVCHPEHHARLASEARQRGVVDHIGDSRPDPEAVRLAGKRAAERRLAAVRDRDQQIAERVRNGELLVDIAASLGIHAKTVREAALRMDAWEGDGRARRGQSMSGTQPEAFATANRRQSQKAEARLLALAARYGAGETAEEMARADGVTVKSMKEALKQAGVALPDGRTNRPKPMLTLTCPVCGTKFDRPASLIRSNAKRWPQPPTCSLSCSAKRRMAQKFAPS